MNENNNTRGRDQVYTCDTTAEVAEACRDVLANGYAKVKSEVMDATG